MQSLLPPALFFINTKKNIHVCSRVKERSPAGKSDRVHKKGGSENGEVIIAQVFYSGLAYALDADLVIVASRRVP